MGDQQLLILTSGGDAPGMNATIRALVRIASYHGIGVQACQHGFQGLIDQQFIPLQVADVANRIQVGGTFLKSARCDTFHDSTIRAQCRQTLAAKKISDVIVIGGNGSLRGAKLLADDGGPRVIGIPASIDNDIFGTEDAIGFDTARNTAVNAIDKIRDTASSHEHHFLIEVMGRESGFLAVDVGIASGAEYIITPEFPIATTQLAHYLTRPKRNKKSCIVVVAEANQPGHSLAIQQELQQLTQTYYRVCILGHIQRGGSPSVADRLLASRLGECAINAILQQQTALMAAWVQGAPTLVPLPTEKQYCRRLADDQLLQLSSMLAI